jgi:hypothetical protein
MQLPIDRRQRKTVAMKLGDFPKRVEGLDPDTILGVAEVDEAFGSEISQVGDHRQYPSA